MNNQEIVSKLWNLCNVLRDDGITYHQYVTELTYILFLKMAKETGAEDRFSQGISLIEGQVFTNGEKQVVLDYRWDRLREKSGLELYKYYKDLLRLFGNYCTGRVREIYQGAATNIEEPKNLEKIIAAIDSLDWFSAREEGLGNLYEGLLEKNAGEKKSGAGQYFTPRVLIEVMTRLMKPQPGERCNDPACGTFGFMIAAHSYVKRHTDDFFDIDADVADDDFTWSTSNKQLNFLQHIYRSLKPDGKARAAVVLPDNVLFAYGDGAQIRADLMDKCNLHTVLRLPTGIFYAQGVKTNVLFFTRGKEEKGNTREVWFYDLRTNMPSFGKTNPLKKEDFQNFEAAYEAADRRAVADERWSVFTREEIEAKGNSLDLGLIRDESVVDYEDLPDPTERGREDMEQLEEALDLIKGVVKRLEGLRKKEED